MTDNPRIEELRRRVQADPASIAFAALAEEYRRIGLYADAIETCRTGLQRHPSYISARVTLGRALIETGEYDPARTELEAVLKVAPENLAAIRAMAEIHERLGHVVETMPPAATAPSAPAAGKPANALPLSQPGTPSPTAPIEASQPAHGTVLEWQPRTPNPEPRTTDDGRRTTDGSRAVLERLEAFHASIVAARAALA